MLRILGRRTAACDGLTRRELLSHLLGIDPHLTVHDLGGRPVPIAHGGEPVEEAIA